MVALLEVASVDTRVPVGVRNTCGIARTQGNSIELRQILHTIKTNAQTKKVGCRRSVTNRRTPHLARNCGSQCREDSNREQLHPLVRRQAVHPLWLLQQKMTSSCGGGVGGCRCKVSSVRAHGFQAKNGAKCKLVYVAIRRTLATTIQQCGQSVHYCFQSQLSINQSRSMLLQQPPVSPAKHDNTEQSTANNNNNNKQTNKRAEDGLTASTTAPTTNQPTNQPTNHTPGFACQRSKHNEPAAAILPLKIPYFQFLSIKNMYEFLIYLQGTDGPLFVVRCLQNIGLFTGDMIQ